MNINYEVIGTFPQMETFRDSLPALLATNGTSEIDRRAIEACAQHFYGIDPAEFDTVAGVIDAIRAMDQDLEAH